MQIEELRHWPYAEVISSLAVLPHFNLREKLPCICLLSITSALTAEGPSPTMFILCSQVLLRACAHPGLVGTLFRTTGANKKKLFLG